MSNAVLTSTIVTREVGVILHNNLEFCRNINRQFDDSQERTGEKDGGSINLRLPNKYKTVTGPALDIQDTAEESVPLVRGTQRHVDVNFTTNELTQSLDDFSGRVLTPAISTLASGVDFDAMSMINQIGNSVGTPGTAPATSAVWLAANQKMSEFATPVTQRAAGLNPAGNAASVDGLKGLFHSGPAISKQFVKGAMSVPALGIDDWFVSQNIRVHTTGSGADVAWQVDEPSATNLAEGSRILDLDQGSGTETLTVGDVFTIAGVNAVNPQNYQSTGSLMQFVVTNAATASGGAITGGTGTGQLQFWPALYTGASGALQNIDHMPSDGDLVVVTGTASTGYPQNIAFHKDAFVLATVNLVLPTGVDFKAREVIDDISVRCVRQYRINEDDIPARFDVLYGYVTHRTEMACRVWG